MKDKDILEKDAVLSKIKTTIGNRLNNQLIRLIVQVGFALVVLSIGYEFYGFVKYCQTNGITKYFERPAGVEAFLPISALISLKYWLSTGIANNIHPAGLVIFIAILVISLLLKKGFCGWICPIGFLSEYLWKFGNKSGVNLKIPKIPDYILRSLKYLLLAFFLYAIMWQMSTEDLRLFIYSPYNKVADVKMLLFFTNISKLTLIVLSTLFVLSVIFKNFWCRYLCPYGALLGILSLFSPVKVSRNKTTCIDCKKCTKVCPSYIDVHKADRVHSEECIACFECVNVCPVKDTLNLRLTGDKIKVPNYIYAIAIVLIYVSIVGVAMFKGYWKNSISIEEYKERIQNIDNPIYEHNRGKVVYE